MSSIARYLPTSVRGSSSVPGTSFVRSAESLRRETEISDAILDLFVRSLPSNYTSDRGGPHYVEQFRALAEELARIQSSLLDAYEDWSDWDFTRGESLYQFLGALVFPDAERSGLPTLPDRGDLSYREFFRTLVRNLLRGTTTEALAAGLAALEPELTFEVRERLRSVDRAGTAWTAGADGNTLEVEVSRLPYSSRAVGFGLPAHRHTLSLPASGTGESGEAEYEEGVSGPAHVHPVEAFRFFSVEAEGLSAHIHEPVFELPRAPETTRTNVRLVDGILSAAETLYTYTNLLREIVPAPVDRLTETRLRVPVYEDARADWNGIRSIRGSGSVPSSRAYLRTAYDLSAVLGGALLRIPTGPNRGTYRVEEIFTFPDPTDSNSFPFTLSPSGISGTGQIENGIVRNLTSIAWSSLGVGERMTIATGPNAGIYRILAIVGEGGGPLGSVVGPGIGARLAAGSVRVTPRFPVSGPSFSFDLELDRFGRVEEESVTEDVSVQFHGTGSSFSRVRTARGPLVRFGSGGREAAAEDVEVTYDGDPVSVVRVDPYDGEIELTDPIDGFDFGEHVVSVTYSILRNATFGLRLGRPGLTLGAGRPTATRDRTTPSGPRIPGALPVRRFSFPVVMRREALPNRRPFEYSPRFLARTIEGSSRLGSPRSLRLNAPPSRYALPPLAVSPVSSSVRFSGSEGPGETWTPVGTFSGETSPEAGAWRTTTEGLGYYRAENPLSGAGTVHLSARLTVSSYSLDGVYAGAGIGYYEGGRLFYGGAVAAPFTDGPDRIRLLGLLIGNDPRERESWTLGPAAIGTPVSPNSIRFPAGDLPGFLRVGGRFVSLSGTQAGAYQIESIGPEIRGFRVVEVSPSFPADPELEGGNPVEALFEVPWSEETATWTLVGDLRTGEATLFYGGSLGGTVRLSGRAPVRPADLGTDLTSEGSADRAGSALFGSISRGGGATIDWYLVRGVATLPPELQSGEGTISDLTFDAETNGGPWFPASAYGDRRFVGGRLVSTSTTDRARYGYAALDPFLTGRNVAVLEGKLSVSGNSSGNGPSLYLRRGRRFVRLSALTYRLTSGAALYANPPEVLDGASTYGLQGWIARTGDGYGTPSFAARGPFADLASIETGRWEIRPEELVTPAAGAFFEVRVGFGAWTFGDDDRTALSFSVRGLTKRLSLEFGSEGRIFLTGGPGSDPILTVSGVTWEDGQARTYRVEFRSGSGTVALLVNGTELDTEPIGSFPSPTVGDADAAIVSEPGLPFEVRFSGLAYGATDEGVSGLGRTFGFLVGPDPGNIDHWIVPRNDGTSAPNSSLDATIVPMDWRSDLTVRVSWDPMYGAALFRPDLDPPPGYAGEWSSETLDVTAAWARVDSGAIPVAPLADSSPDYGEAFFGSIRSSSNVSWDRVRYRVYSTRAPSRRTVGGGAIGRVRTASSGELATARTLRSATLPLRTLAEVRFSSVDLRADRVVEVYRNETLLPEGSWTFDRSVGAIRFATPAATIEDRILVRYVPGGPVTGTYLETAPISESRTLLAEGTPSFASGRVGREQPQVVSASGGPEPAFPPAGPSNPNYFLRDPYLVRSTEYPDSAVYSSAEFYAPSNDGARYRMAGARDELISTTLRGSDFAESPPLGIGGGSPTPPEPILLGGDGAGLGAGSILFGFPLGGDRVPGTPPDDFSAFRFFSGFAEAFDLPTESLSYRLSVLADYARLGPDRPLYGGEAFSVGGMILEGGGELPPPSPPTVGTL